jgi:hypothetical protein
MDNQNARNTPNWKVRPIIWPCKLRDSPTSCKHRSPIPALRVNACWIRAIGKQNQSTLMLLEQMANYIHAREAQLNSIPQSGFQTW